MTLKLDKLDCLKVIGNKQILKGLKVMLSKFIYHPGHLFRFGQSLLQFYIYTHIFDIGQYSVNIVTVIDKVKI